MCVCSRVYTVCGEGSSRRVHFICLQCDWKHVACVGLFRYVHITHITLSPHTHTHTPYHIPAHIFPTTLIAAYARVVFQLEIHANMISHTHTHVRTCTHTCVQTCVNLCTSNGYYALCITNIYTHAHTQTHTHTNTHNRDITHTA